MTPRLALEFSTEDVVAAAEGLRAFAHASRWIRQTAAVVQTEAAEADLRAVAGPDADAAVARARDDHAWDVLLAQRSPWPAPTLVDAYEAERHRLLSRDYMAPEQIPALAVFRAARTCQIHKTRRAGRSWGFPGEARGPGGGDPESSADTRVADVLRASMGRGPLWAPWLPKLWQPRPVEVAVSRLLGRRGLAGLGCGLASDPRQPTDFGRVIRITSPEQAAAVFGPGSNIAQTTR